MQTARAISVVAVLAILAAPGMSHSDSGPASTTQQLGSVSSRIVNGIDTTDYPSAGILLTPGNPNTAGLICSGTLIGCQTFLTAGHCVEGALNPANYLVFLQNAGFFSVSSVSLHPDYNFPVGDVAVLKLSTPVTGIRPMTLNTALAPSAGTAGTIVGFGRTGGNVNTNQDYGLKRVGSVTTATCTSGISNTTSVCWNFNNPLGSAGTNSNTCNGDSGGPLFIDFGSGLTLAGVTSGGDSNTCLPNDISFDANVYTYRSWIQTQGGTDLNNTSCGDIPQVGGTDTQVVSVEDSLSSGNPSSTTSFEVGAGTDALRVAMNAIDDGSDFDLYVKAGSPPTTADYDCRQNGSNQYGFCEFGTPAAGTWYALVDRFSGSGAFQLTATIIGGGCADPANNGQPCDDNNACTDNDICQGGSCLGTPATDGTSCDDQQPCTANDSCQAGTCTGDATPQNGCLEPVVSNRGLFLLKDPTPGEADAKDKLTWKWLKGDVPGKSEFGDPVASTAYDLCVYGEVAGTPTVLMSQHITGGTTCGTKACWKETNTGFRYSDRKGTNGAVRYFLMKEGAAGKAKIIMRAKGTALGLPTLPLDLQTPLTVQLTNGSACWEGVYDSSIKNELTQFKAKSAN